ncbi:hypothetical protein RRG08_059412 [Elysia crispata]|uniref:Uncharacterized protein n=1 Tax=Elysia crispata TaxID=231223 RepID=A0AAE0YZT4_9GAST|nr:hypothetical protein RRG08_059412 [Elysia crispata]
MVGGRKTRQREHEIVSPQTAQLNSGEPMGSDQIDDRPSTTQASLETWPGHGLRRPRTGHVQAKIPTPSSPPQCGLLNSVDERYFYKALRPKPWEIKKKKKVGYKNVHKSEMGLQILHQCPILKTPN